MASFDNFSWTVVDWGGYAWQLAYDGTYIWFICQLSSPLNTKRLYRLRHSDKQLIKPDGTIGDYSNAYVTISNVGTIGNATGIATNGTRLLLSHPDYFQLWDCATMTQIGGNSTLYAAGDARIAAFDGTDFWMAAYVQANGNTFLVKCTPTGTLTYYATPNRLRGIRIAGGFIWGLHSNSTSTFAAKHALDGTFISTVSAGNMWNVATNSYVNDIAYDAARGDMWCSLGGGESVRFRVSDGAWLTAAGSVVATSALARTNMVTHPTDCKMTYSGGLIVIDDMVYVGGTGSNNAYKEMQKRSVTTGLGSGYWHAGSLPHGVGHFLQVGSTLYGSLGGEQYWAGAGVMWAEVTAATPNLTAAEASGSGVLLTYDNAVTLSGSATYGTLGGPGITVTGANQPTASSIQLTVTKPSTHITNVVPASVPGYAINVTFDQPVISAGTAMGPAAGKLSLVSIGQIDSTNVGINLDISSPALTLVDGNATDIQLTFSESLTYAGAYSQTPVGSNFVIDQPVLSPGTLLTIPVSAGSLVPRVLNAAKADSTGIILNFDGPLNLSGTIDYGTTVNGLRIDSGTQPTASSAHLVPSYGIGGSSEWVPVPISVTGVGVTPSVSTAYALNSTTFVLIFSEEVTEASATNIAHYTISPALDILSITKVDTLTYHMSTSPQTANTTYSVTLAGVLDRANNPI